jgi:hypothetical protein
MTSPVLIDFGAQRGQLALDRRRIILAGAAEAPGLDAGTAGALREHRLLFDRREIRSHGEVAQSLRAPPSRPGSQLRSGSMARAAAASTAMEGGLLCRRVALLAWNV